MFNWTTTTIINELSENLIKDLGNNKLRIGKHLFERKWVESIRKAKGKNVKLCEASLNMETVKSAVGNATVARLYIYVGLEGSEESIYANDLYRKGMPLSVSFAVTGNAADMANAIVNTVKTFNVFTKVKKVLEVTASGSTLKIKGTHEHQRIQKIVILVENNSENNKLGEETPVLTWDLSEYHYTKTLEGGEQNYITKTGVTLVNVGVNGFGTYSQLIKDLKLPTAVNTNWVSVQKDEMPIVGALYTQYIITYYAPSMANPSFTAIGNRSMSETTHVFWVKQELDKDGNATGVLKAWEDFLIIIDPDKDNDLETNVVIPGSDIFVNDSLVEGSGE